jgi:type VI secretion system protein ImpM
MSYIKTADSPVIFFGKLPARGDFIRSHTGSALIQVFDRWVSETLALLLAVEPGWKTLYDKTSPADVAFFRPQTGFLVLSSVMASKDSAGRRFPFISATTFEVQHIQSFIGVCPLYLFPVWDHLRHLSQEAAQVPPEDHAFMDKLHNEVCHFQQLCQQAEDQSHAFFTHTSLGALEAHLCTVGFNESMRQVVLAIGMLLEPTLDGSGGELKKILRFPLPTDPALSALCASFWLRLLAGFLMKMNCEVTLYRTDHRSKPCLCLGFNGASPEGLYAVMDPSVENDYIIDLHNLNWVESYLDSSIGVGHLSTLLKQDDMALQDVTELFDEAFLRG